LTGGKLFFQIVQQIQQILSGNSRVQQGIILPLKHLMQQKRAENLNLCLDITWFARGLNEN